MQRVITVEQRSPVVSSCKFQLNAFSDPQGGKGPCNRKAATIKSHMRIHLNSRNDIETPDQMKDAILSSGGVPSVDVTLCEPMAATNITALKVPGVSLLNNIKFENNGIRVWRAYDIGPGKFIPRSKLNLPSSPNVPSITVTSVQLLSKDVNLPHQQKQKMKITRKNLAQQMLTMQIESLCAPRRVHTDLFETFINAAPFGLQPTQTRA